MLHYAHADCYIVEEKSCYSNYQTCLYLTVVFSIIAATIVVIIYVALGGTPGWRDVAIHCCSLHLFMYSSYTSTTLVNPVDQNPLSELVIFMFIYGFTVSNIVNII